MKPRHITDNAHVVNANQCYSVHKRCDNEYTYSMASLNLHINAPYCHIIIGLSKLIRIMNYTEDFMIYYRSLHNVDVATNQIGRKVIPADFNSFIEEYIRFATEENKSTKDYKVCDPNTTVVHCVDSIISQCEGREWLDLDTAVLDSYADSIANKLLREEINAQEIVANLGIEIKRGSLVQALIGTNRDNIRYIIAKVEHSEWYDGESLRKTFGFPSKSKNVWKSAVIPIKIDEEGTIDFGIIRVYTDNVAKYWAERFLELEEANSDESNTSRAFEAVELELKRSMKKHFRRDFYILRDSMLSTMKTRQLFNYDDVIGRIFTGYQPEEDGLTSKLQSIKQRLLNLPDKKKFDRQFNTVPEVLKKKRRLAFRVKEGIELRITGDETDFMDDITAYTNSVGKRYLQIRCVDQETYNVFAKRQ